MLDIFTREGLISFLYNVPALFIAFAVHEFAHAYVAYKLGDRSQKALGRLTLDPFAHIDWIGFFCLALFHFGWGKPVMVDDRNFKNRSRDNMLVALAGPVSNFITAIIFTIIFKILVITNIATSATYIFNNILFGIIFLNIALGIFNLLPIPPLDGSKILTHILPSKFKQIIYTIDRYSFYILLFLLATGVLGRVITPILGFFGNLVINIVFM